MKPKIHEHKQSLIITMSKIFFVVAIAVTAIGFLACNNGNNAADNQQPNAVTDAASASATGKDSMPMANGNAPIQPVVAGYLQIKNALAADNGSDAAAGGKAMVAALNGLNTASFTDAQKKSLSDMQDDLKENAEHIGENAGKIAHQREHFEMLSQDMYDLVKAFPASENLYKDFCPMYNDNKGAFWLSETKEIKNPYLGKKMATCGEIKEEIKQ